MTGLLSNGFQQRLVPPPLSGWSFVQQEATQLDFSFNRACMRRTNVNDNKTVLIRSCRTTYDVATMMLAFGVNVDAQYGIALRQSSNNRLVLFYCYELGTGERLISIDRWNTPTSFNTSLLQVPGAYGDPYLRITEGPTGLRRYFISNDGNRYHEILNEASNAFVTVDGVGIVIGAESLGSPGSINVDVLHWTLALQ